MIHAHGWSQLIRELPVGQREVVAAVDFAGLGYSEAATQLQIPVGTVMSRLHRGRLMLRDRLRAFTTGLSMHGPAAAYS